MKDFIRLNTNDSHLSLGNLFRILKESSNNTANFWQQNLFSIIFETDDIADSTVNNYCTGLRAINPIYKEFIRNKSNELVKNPNIYVHTIEQILNLIENTNNTYTTVEQINQNTLLKKICSKLYSISKNDVDARNVVSETLYSYLCDNNLYMFFITVINYVTLEKIQPIFFNEKVNELIEENIFNTNISMQDVQDYIHVQLNSGICSIRVLLELAKKENPFACFEIGSMEYFGILAGKPRYEKAYHYYKVAAYYNHPIAIWAIGYLYYKGFIGTKSRSDLYYAFKYFNKARKLNCSYAYNSIGNLYLTGMIKHIPKNKNKAIEYYKKAISMNNIYACNNLGKLYESTGKINEALECYLQSSKQNESWALNKLGEFYRTGVAVEKNHKKAFEYYTEASNVPIFTLCPWSKYNLAKYYYLNGNVECGIKKDTKTAIQLLEDVSSSLIEAIEELIYISYDLYLKNNKDTIYKNQLDRYVRMCESHTDYNDEIKQKIETILNEIEIKHKKIQLPN